MTMQRTIPERLERPIDGVNHVDTDFNDMIDVGRAWARISDPGRKAQAYNVIMALTNDPRRMTVTGERKLERR